MYGILTAYLMAMFHLYSYNNLSGWRLEINPNPPHANCRPHARRSDLIGHGPCATRQKNPTIARVPD